MNQREGVLHAAGALGDTTERMDAHSGKPLRGDTAEVRDAHLVRSARIEQRGTGARCRPDGSPQVIPRCTRRSATNPTPHSPSFLAQYSAKEGK